MSLNLDRLRRHYIPELTMSLIVCLTRVGHTRRRDLIQLIDALMSSHPRNLESLFSENQLVTIGRSSTILTMEC